MCQWCLDTEFIQNMWTLWPLNINVTACLLRYKFTFKLIDKNYTLIDHETKIKTELNKLTQEIEREKSLTETVNKQIIEPQTINTNTK